MPAEAEKSEGGHADLLAVDASTGGVRGEDLGVARQLAARAPDMPGEQALGAVEIAVADRGDDEPVLVMDGLAARSSMSAV